MKILPRNPRYLAAALISAATMWCLLSTPADASTAKPPNIVYILADDLGYGDVQCLTPSLGKIPTPNLDRMAAAGMIFTDMHSGSSVCTPTRYGLLTGRYSWRSKQQSFVLMGDGKPLVPPDRFTVAHLLKSKGYTTACIGKWHLGMNFALLPEAPKEIPATGKIENPSAWKYDYAGKVGNAPVVNGFDYFFGIAASLDMWPFVYIQDDRFTAIPTVEKRWIQVGPAATDFEAVDVLPTLTRKATEYIDSRAADAKNGKPFFLYFPLPSPHTPIVPSAEWKGKSPLGEYGDFVMQTDATVGDVLAALERNGLTENTLIIFTADNGASWGAHPDRLQRLGHYVSAQFRGVKSDIWEGGHRVPFIARWPARVKPGSRSDQLGCLTDLAATCADILGEKLPNNAGEDSVSMLPALTGKDSEPLREAVIHHSVGGRFAVRKGNWKLALCYAGGANPKSEEEAEAKGLPPIQLYDLSTDIGEQINLQAKHPEIVAELTALLEKYIAEGRSTPGVAQTNDAKIDIWKKKKVTSAESAPKPKPM